MGDETEVMNMEIVDEDGENLAVRAFLVMYPSCRAIGKMKQHMELSGYPLWPDWVVTAHPREHLTKAGAQLWIRYLLGLEVKLLSSPAVEIVGQ